MPVSSKSINQKIYDLLRSRGMDPIPLDSTGRQDIDIENADVFRFEFKEDDSVVGTGWATLEDKEIVLYIDNNLSDNDAFLNFMQFVKRWSQRQLLGFKISNRDHLSSDMKKRTSMNKKEQLGEGYYPMGKKASYNDAVPTVKILLQHTRQIEEGEQRFRNIAKIFVENLNGERFLLPTTRPGLARVFARHIAEGGTPYDDRGRHISNLVEEYTKMAGFVRATRNGQFNESAGRLVQEGINHYQNLRETLSRMTSHRGYNTYFESYTPVLNEEADDEATLNELFVQETLDPRIESVLPILNRLSKNITEMNEVKELEEWAESITEVEDETTKTLAEPAADMLEEVDTGEYDARKTTPSSKEKQEKVFAKHRERMKNLDEAPGAETLAHDDETEKSNLKAFDLEEKRIGNRKEKDVKPVMSKSGSSALDKAKKDAEDLGNLKIDSKEMGKWGKLLKTAIGVSEEDDMEEGIKDITKKVGKKFRQSAIGRAREYGYSIEEGFSPSEEVADMIEKSMGGAGELTSDDIYLAIDEYQTMMDNPEELDTEEVAQILIDRFHSKGIMVPDVNECGVGYENNPKVQKLNEFGPAIAAGARVALPLLAKLGPKLANIFKSGAKAAGKGSVKVAKGTADIAAKNAPTIGAGLGVYNAITDTAEEAVGGVGEVYTDIKDAVSAIADKVGNTIDAKSVFELANMAVKFALPIGIVLGILYGGKKLIDQVMAEPSDGSLNELEDWQEEHNEKEMNRMKDLAFNAKPFDEGLDANQKRAGQLGPTEKVGPKGAVGKLVGANESTELEQIKALSGIK